MLDLNDIYSLTEFQRSAREHLKRLKATGRPEVLTVNGRSEVVVQDVGAYQELLDRLDEAEALLALQEAAHEMEQGQGAPAAEALPRLRKRLGIRERLQ